MHPVALRSTAWPGRGKGRKMRTESPHAVTRDLVVMGSSAGGVEALPRVLRDLPRELAAAVLIVQHLGESSPRFLVDILSRASALPVEWAEQGAPIARGRIYVAPPDLHLLIADGHLRLARSARENRARPSIDKLFRSVAAEAGSRAIGVLLTGMLGDGVAGLRAIRDAGGAVIVQDPADAKFAELPSRALLAFEPDRLLPIDAIGAAIAALVGEAVQPAGAVPRSLALEAAFDRAEAVTPTEMDQLGALTTLVCPECSGPLWQLQDEGFRRYRCYLGHVATARELVVTSGEQAESALWSAVRALDGQAAVLEALAAEAQRIGGAAHTGTYDARAREVRAQAQVARRFLLDLTSAARPGV